MPLLRLLIWLGFAVLLTGCWAATIPHGVPKSLGDPDMLDPLIGQHYEKVTEALGLPDQRLTIGDTRYMIYQTLGDGTDILFIVWIPIPVPDLGDKYNNSALHCLKFEIDAADRIKKYKIKSGGWKGAISSHDKSVRCREFFWSKKKLASAVPWTK